MSGCSHSWERTVSVFPVPFGGKVQSVQSVFRVSPVIPLHPISDANGMMIPCSMGVQAERPSAQEDLSGPSPDKADDSQLFAGKRPRSPFNVHFHVFSTLDHCEIFAILPCSAIANCHACIYVASMRSMGFRASSSPHQKIHRVPVRYVLFFVSRRGALHSCTLSTM